MADAIEKLVHAIDEVVGQYYRLILLVGPPGSGKTALLHSLAGQKGYPYFNINLELSQRMLELTRAQRTRQVATIFKGILGGIPGDVRLLDNLEILFDSGLQLDPLRLLQSCSRNQTTVVSWNGTYKDGTLLYAEPGHPEFVQYKQAEALVVALDHNAVP